jgi:hypothetical protein
MKSVILFYFYIVVCVFLWKWFRFERHSFDFVFLVLEMGVNELMWEHKDDGEFLLCSADDVKGVFVSELIVKCWFRRWHSCFTELGGKSVFLHTSSKIVDRVLRGIYFDKVEVEWKDVRDFVWLCSYLGIQMPNCVCKLNCEMKMVVVEC